MKKIILHGRKVVGGSAEGTALVTRENIAGYGVIDIYTGTITERGHELRNKSISGKILVFPTGKGSSAWSVGSQACRLTGNSPKALVIKEINTQVALGAVVMRIPAVTDLDQDPIKVISNGDWVKVDADKGRVEIIKKYPKNGN